MKRNWEGSSYGGGSNNQQSNGMPDGQDENGGWVQMSSHPYAQAYSSMPNPFQPSPLHNSTTYSDQHNSGYMDNGLNHGHVHQDKKAKNVDMRNDSIISGGSPKDGLSDDDDDDEDDDDDDNDGAKTTPAGKGKGKGKGDKPKVKLTRGSRACIACRKIKMRCIPDEGAGPGAPCKRCKSGGHECIFEESNRGKRSTRKNEAMAAKMAKFEAALKGIGAALSNLDQPALNSFSTALHGSTGDTDIINLITSHTSPSAVPTLAVAMNRQPYNTGGDGFSGEDAQHGQHHSQPPLSPRLHSLPDNVLSPLGLLAEASLQNTNDTSNKKSKSKSNYHHSHNSNNQQGGNNNSQNKNLHRTSALSYDGRSNPPPRSGSPLGMSPGGSYRLATSDIRGGNNAQEDEEPHMFNDNGQGVASHNYFKLAGTFNPAAGMSDTRLPELMTIVSRDEIGELFETFFDNMAFHVPLVYREFHTPDLVLQRSQFLCTVICALAARYYHKRPELHAQLSAYAKRLAFEVPSRGYKSVEVVQAYLLLSLWTLGPEKTFEQDRTWLMLGMAIRMATDLNLHRKSIVSGLDTEEGKARDLEIINRERCWLHCFVLDRSLSAQMGKPYTLREDYIIRNACEASWHQQRFSLPSDRPLSAYVVLQQIMSRAIDSIYSSTTTVSGLRHDCDYMLIVRSAHEELRRWLTEWNRPEQYVGIAGLADGRAEYDSRAQFYFAYSSLVLYSFGLENALERAKMDISFFLTNVYEAATRVCTVVKEEFLPKGYLPYLPDTNFVMCSYALLSLLKLLKPELRPYHDSEEAIFKLVSEMADILEDCAVDPAHQPAIYAAFIREIVRKTRELRHGPGTAPTSPGTLLSQQIHGTMATGHPIAIAPIAGTVGTDHSTAVAAAVAAAAAAQQANNAAQGVYDPQLMGEHANWQPGDLLPGHSGETQFTFIPQGGDMMILPSQAGPSIAPSPTAAFLANPLNSSSSNNTLTGNYVSTPTGNSNGWAEYLPTFMSSDGFDGWDGSMLLPGFGRNQITLGGGLLHSQHGSGIITPSHQTPSHSRMGSRAGSRAQTPHHGSQS
ncbi:uncharacterized protein I206_107610 [Kwoniella pini CBS 10737]|uniref:Zn(2)-C6 fungal-type domain-containing protein n=1 Tax=Kwoniella pini CBS 10737 TaxID=1296096 RepID=A0A1B9HXS7_9TREE|nr:uncharacterized protein I206_05943 [Kwoniella pini CBS 10737]OCF48076.1 hypothetical protein I206_05943 [Kwoniella pini CBS 10737]